MVKIRHRLKLKNIFSSHSLSFFVGILTSTIETKESRGGSKERIQIRWVRPKECLFLFEVVRGVSVELKVDVWCFRGAMPLAVVNINPGWPQETQASDIRAVRGKSAHSHPYFLLFLYLTVMWICGKVWECCKKENAIQVCFQMGWSF